MISEAIIAQAAAEGWEIWGSDNPDSTFSEWHYLHVPSARAITVLEASDGHRIVTEENREWTSGHFVISRVHGKDGEPVEWVIMGPYSTIAEAFRWARIVRRSIVDERRVDVRIAEQAELFPGFEHPTKKCCANGCETLIPTFDEICQSHVDELERLMKERGVVPNAKAIAISGDEDS
jgi:hypothetical protein